ncbi:hypothetical protein [Phytohabitans suffuscus]|uniref:Uncharacterized protein n=1 Tax=Phytohabitans suffuscus TaxID=624315 RepID=A0A6F8YU70_9ACTN|nr:hypothetical protein [Phytohabitans suffuscus]BCB89523.1 hypothetical protein Psuf_068360 [Phytohabitans suffuscus]
MPDEPNDRVHTADQRFRQVTGILDELPDVEKLKGRFTSEMTRLMNALAPGFSRGPAATNPKGRARAGGVARFRLLARCWCGCG